VPNWRMMLARGLEAGDDVERVNGALRSGRPIGAASWLSGLDNRRLAARR